MENSKKKNPTTRFLIYSFIGLLIFSIIVFSLLGIYMSRKSKKAVYEIGQIYMSGMNEQMSRHFETVIKLRFNQVSGIVSVVSTDNSDKTNLYEELIYRTQVRGFDYLALCSAGGDFQTLYGQSIQPLNPEPFVEALVKGEKVQLIGFGNFEVSKRPAREGINPATKEKITIAAANVPKFKAGAALKNALN